MPRSFLSAWIPHSLLMRRNRMHMSARFASLILRNHSRTPALPSAENVLSCWKKEHHLFILSRWVSTSLNVRKILQMKHNKVKRINWLWLEFTVKQLLPRKILLSEVRTLAYLNPRHPDVKSGGLNTWPRRLLCKWNVFYEQKQTALYLCVQMYNQNS